MVIISSTFGKYVGPVIVNFVELMFILTDKSIITKRRRQLLTHLHSIMTDIYTYFSE